MDVRSCAFSGHRIIYRTHKEPLNTLLSDTVDALISSGISRFCSGGAKGFDLLAAELILKKRNEGAHVSLCMILPCQDQAARWPCELRKKYEEIISLADEVIYTGEKYDQFCMHIRNRRLVDESEVLLCYLNREASGTAYTRNYAAERGKKIINLADML